MENEKTIEIGAEVTRREALKVGALTAAGAMLAIAGIGAGRPSEALAHTTLYTDQNGISYWYDDGCGLTDAEVSDASANTAWKPVFTAKGKAKGKKLKATEAQCEKIAHLLAAEWGSNRSAIAAGASLLANRFELYGKKYGNVYNYARKSGYFANAPELMDTAITNSKNIAIVKAVLTQGKRTLPAYVDEYECLNDIKYAKTGKKRVTGKTALAKKSSYTRHKTTVGTSFGKKCTFYGWIGDGVACYASAKTRKKYGEGYWILES